VGCVVGESFKDQGDASAGVLELLSSYTILTQSGGRFHHIHTNGKSSYQPGPLLPLIDSLQHCRHGTAWILSQLCLRACHSATVTWGQPSAVNNPALLLACATPKDVGSSAMVTTLLQCSPSKFYSLAIVVQTGTGGDPAFTCTLPCGNSRNRELAQ
jgi:hypothetical protein